MNWPPAPASGGPRWASGPTDRAHRLRARRTVPAAGGLLGHEVRAAFARRRALGAAQLRAVRRRHALHLPEWPGYTPRRVSAPRPGWQGALNALLGALQLASKRMSVALYPFLWVQCHTH